MIDLQKNTVTEALKIVDFSNINRLLEPIDTRYVPYDPSGIIGQPEPALQMIMFLHYFGMLVQCHNNNMTAAQINAFKNLSYYQYTASGEVVDVSAGVDFTNNTTLPIELSGVQLVEELWEEMGKLKVWNNGVHIAQGDTTFRDTPVAHAVINMYKHLFKNLVDNSANSVTTPLLTLNEFFNVTFMTEYHLTNIIINVNLSYRTQVPDDGKCCQHLLTSDQKAKLTKLTDRINYKLIKEFTDRAVAAGLPSAYKFYGTYNGVSGTLSDFITEATTGTLVLPTDDECSCM